MQILTYNEICTGCRVCELACSFHFGRRFKPKASAVEIRRYELEGKFGILIHEEPSGDRNGCDLCSGEKGPLCVKYCSIGALRVGRETL